MTPLFCPVCGQRVGVYQLSERKTCPNCGQSFAVTTGAEAEQPKKPRRVGPSETKEHKHGA